MVAIAPFRALRYAPGIDLDAVTSPPHDTIFGDEARAFQQRDPRNIANVILPDGAYEEAAARLRAWQEDGTLVRDQEPALYLYEVHHENRVMTGLFCRVRLDPTYTEIKRHERTLKKKKTERLDLLRATDCNTEPIWMLYRDERGWVEEVMRGSAFDEVARCTDEEGATHVLHRVDRSEGVQEVVAQFDERHLVIADGHHRYQTSLDRFAETGRETDESILVCLVRDTDPGVAILPTHRLVSGLDHPDAASALDVVEHWDVGRLEPGWLQDVDGLVGGLDDRSCIVVGRDQDGAVVAWRLVLREGHEVEGHGTLDALAVTRVHDRLLRDAWGIDAEHVEHHLRFTQKAATAVADVREGACELAVLMPPESPESVLDVCEEGNLMPQKATYFVPKLRSGLVLSPCDEPVPKGWQGQVTDPGRAEFRLPSLD